jgi:histidine triad (HIT) family protein
MDIFCLAETKLAASIIDRSEHFFLLHDGFPLAKGHLILIPRKHRDCFFNLTAQEQSEFLILRKKIIAFLTQTILSPVMFEHGAIAQTVPHAHLHFLPTDKSMRGEIEKIAVPMEKQAPPYLYYEDGRGATYYRVTEEIIPGFLHTTFAKVLGRPVKGPDRAGEAAAWTSEIKQAWDLFNR